MDINKMKVGLSYIFYMNENIDNATKKQVLNYIEASSLEQLKALALDGDIHANLSKAASKIINIRFNENSDLIDKIDKAALKGINELIALKEGPLRFGAKIAGKIANKTMLWGVTTLLPIWVANRTVQAVFSQEKRRCGVFGIGKSRVACLIQAKITKFSKEANLMKQNMKSCNDNKNPESCRKKHTAIISKASNKVFKLKAKLAKLPSDSQDKGVRKYKVDSTKAI